MKNKRGQLRNRLKGKKFPKEAIVTLKRVKNRKGCHEKRAAKVKNKY